MSCGCGKARAGELCQECELPVFARNNYFTGKFMAARDFIDEQRYFLGKLRRHDEYLHGWGTVCGLEVTPHPQAACRDRWVVVQPGVAVDCCGREIVVREPEYVDVRAAFEAWWVKQGKDPAKIDDGSAHTLQLVLRYVECPTEDVPVLFDDAGCDDTRCQPNRVLESYAIDVTIDDPVHPLGAPPLPSAVLERLAVAGADLLAVAGTGRLFVARAGATPSIEAYDDTDLPAIGSATLSAEATVLAVSGDGTNVFVGEDDGADAIVHILDGADPALAEVTSVTLPGGGGGALRLVYDGVNDRALALTVSDGQVRAFAPDGSGLVTVATLAGALDLAGSGDANRVYLVDGTASVTVVDAHNPATPATTLALGAGAKGRLVALLPAGYPGADDRLVVAVDDAAGPTLVMLVRHSNGSSDKYAEPLAVAPIALALDPGGHYVAAAGDRSDGTAVVQVVAVAGLTAPAPASPTVVNVGTKATAVAVDTDGRVLAAATMSTPGGKPGGIAILGPPVGVCRDLWQRSLDGCPSCAEDDVLVLATIGAYQVGDVLDETRIDNLTDRRLLPSVSLLAEVVQCLLDQDAAGTGAPGKDGKDGTNGINGTNGTNGINGTDGEKGDPGTDSDLPHVVAINWPHGGRMLMTGEVLDDQGEVLGRVDIAHEGLIIGFSEPMMPETLTLPARDWSSLTVLFEGRRSDDGPLETRCWCEVVGRVEALSTESNCKDGIISPGDRVEKDATGVRFRPINNEWIRGRYRVVLKGDYVLAERTITKTRTDGSTFDVQAVLDGNHLAPGILGPGGVGPRGLPPRCPSGDWIEGGTFESWFEIFLDP